MSPVLTKAAVRIAIHEFFQQEKKSSVSTAAVPAYAVFEQIFQVCLKNESDMFFVSQALARGRVLRELWHHRIVHLVAEGQLAFADGEPGTYDIYVVDFGRYVSMYGSKRGAEMADRLRSMLDKAMNENSAVFGRILTWVWKPQNWFSRIVWNQFETAFEGLAVTQAPVEDRDLGSIVDNCSSLVVDPLLKTK